MKSEENERNGEVIFYEWKSSISQTCQFPTHSNKFSATLKATSSRPSRGPDKLTLQPKRKHRGGRREMMREKEEGGEQTVMEAEGRGLQ